MEYVYLSGYHFSLISFPEDTASDPAIRFPSNWDTTFRSSRRQNDEISIGDFSPCARVLNNDFSNGLPESSEGYKQHQKCQLLQADSKQHNWEHEMLDASLFHADAHNTFTSNQQQITQICQNFVN